MSNEYQWAEALRKAQQNEKQRKPNFTSFSEPKVSLEQLQEQMAYYKNKLEEAVENNNTAEMQSLVDRLITCHARMTAMLIKNEKTFGEKNTSPVVDSHLQKYFSDCASLLQILPS